MAASPSARESQLRRQITVHEAQAKRDRAASARAARLADRERLARAARQHDERAKELRVQLARTAGASAPSQDVAESKRQRRIEALRGAIARHQHLARQARGVGNRSVESTHAAEAKRAADELSLLEHRDRRVTVASSAPPKATFAREPAPSHLSTVQRAKLRKIDTEIDTYLRNAATYRDRARRASEGGQAGTAAKAVQDATIMESMAKSLMAARRQLLYKQGEGMKRGGLPHKQGRGMERRVDASELRPARGAGDKTLITRAAVPGVRAPNTMSAMRSGGFQPPRADTESTFTRSVDPDAEEMDPSLEPSAAADASAPGAAEAATTDDEGGGGSTIWWILGGVLGLGALAFAMSRKKGAASSGSPSRPAFTLKPAASEPKPNPRRRRRPNRRHGRNHDRRCVA